MGKARLDRGVRGSKILFMIITIIIIITYLCVGVCCVEIKGQFGGGSIYHVGLGDWIQVIRLSRQQAPFAG